MDRKGESRKGQISTSLWWAVFWISFPFGILNFMLPIYGRELGASAFEIGGFFSAFSIIPALVRPFLGRVLDRWGRRPFLLLGLGGYVLATVAFALADSVLLLTMGRILQGFGSAFLWIATFTMIADLSEVDFRGFQFGSIDEATYRGGILGTSLGFAFVFILQEHTALSIQEVWFWLFVLYLVPSGIGFIRGYRGTTETLPPLSASKITSKRLSGQLLALMGIVLLTGASQAMTWPLLMIYLQDKLGAGVSELALAYLPAALLSSFLPSRMGKLADRWGRKGPMVIGLLIGAAASLAIPQLEGILYLILLWCLETIGYSVSIPAERAFVADIAGEDIRGTSYGLYTFSFFLGGALGPLLGGWLYDQIGQSLPFYLNAAVLIVGALLVSLFLRETGQQPQNHQLPG